MGKDSHCPTLESSMGHWVQSHGGINRGSKQAPPRQEWGPFLGYASGLGENEPVGVQPQVTHTCR